MSDRPSIPSISIADLTPAVQAATKSFGDMLSHHIFRLITRNTGRFEFTFAIEITDDQVIFVDDFMIKDVTP